MRRWGRGGGKSVIAIPYLRHGSWGTSNNWKWTMPGTPKSYKEKALMITKKMFVYCCAFNHSLFAQNSFFSFFYDQSYFYSSSFQNYSRTSVENSRTFQGTCEKRFDGKWSLAESSFKQRYCNVVTHGSLPSCCITSLYHSKFEIAPKLSI